MQNYLPACKIVSTHGVRGEMKALPLCDGAAFLAKFKRLFTTADGAGETRVLGVRAQGNVILLPAVPEFVKNIDIDARKILVTPIEGMFTEAVNGDED